MTDRGKGDRYHVLLVEDDRGDARMTEVAFEEASIDVDLHVVADGRTALDFLFGRGEYPDPPFPDLVLLDLDLPTLDGETVLEEIKNHAVLQRIPVVVLTSSCAPRHVARSYELRASACVTKPVDADEFGELVDTLSEFWFATARLPPKPEEA